jgi:hypothetical protein
MKKIKEELNEPKIKQSLLEKEKIIDLIKLIKSNDYKGVQNLIEEGVYVNREVIKTSLSKFAPYYDTSPENDKNRLEIFKLLIENGRINKPEIIETAIQKFKKYHEKNEFLKKIYIPEIIINDNALENNEVVINSGEKFPFICIKDSHDENILLQYIIIGLNNSNGDYKLNYIREPYINTNDIYPILNIIKTSTLNHLNNEILGINNGILDNSDLIIKVLEEDNKNQLINYFYKKENLTDEKGKIKPPLDKEIIQKLTDIFLLSHG